MYRKWEIGWQQEPTCTQTRNFYPFLRPQHSWEMINSIRPIYSMLIQLETGHNYMARHQHLINKSAGDDESTPVCTLCGSGEQTSAHILAECTELAEIRLKHFGISYLLPPYINLDRSSLLGFLREAPIEELNFFLNEGEHS